MTVYRGPFNSVYAEHAALHAIGTGLILTLTFAACFYYLTLRLTACTIRLTAVILRLAACRLTLSGSYSLTIRLTACLLSLTGLLSIYSLTLT